MFSLVRPHKQSCIFFAPLHASPSELDRIYYIESSAVNSHLRKLSRDIGCVSVYVCVLLFALIKKLKMSLHRVSSLENFQFIPHEDRSRRGSGSDTSIRARKLSFNPLPEAWDPVHLKDDTVQAVGAFEVPRWKRIRKCSLNYHAPSRSYSLQLTKLDQSKSLSL